MDVTPLVDSDVKVVRAVKPGEIIVNDQIYTQSIILFSNTVLPLEVKGVQDLNPDALLSLLEEQDDIDLLLIGTGERQEFIPPSIRAPFSVKGVGIEFMDTQAACRTYNVLIADGRRLAAVLMI